MKPCEAEPANPSSQFWALPVRGVHLDCRAQMLRCERIVEIRHDLARRGFNALLLEYENRFPFSGGSRASGLKRR